VNSARLLIGERIILTLWVGGLWTVGYLVAPALFANLDDRALAGSLAATLFEIIAWFGLASAFLLLIINQIHFADQRLNWRMLVLVTMLLLVAAGQFVLAPLMGDLRAAGDADSAAFARLHGLASVIYLVNSLLGLVLVIAQNPRR
jgi:hypothetical protein